MISVLHLICTLTLAGVFLVSGTLKLRDRGGSKAAVEGFSIIPQRFAGLIASTLPWVEIALGVGLLVLPGTPFTVIALGALLLMLAFTALIAWALRQDEAPACHCFGEVSEEPVSPWTLARNIALVAVALGALLLARPFKGVIPTLFSLPLAEVLLTLVSAAAIGAIAWLVVRWRSAEASVASLTTERDKLAQELEAEQQRPAAQETPEIPDAIVIDGQGNEISLGDLVTEAGKAQLLISISPTCSACKDLEPYLPVWRRELGGEIGITLIARGTWGNAAEAYPEHVEHLYASPDGSALEALGMDGTPAASLLGLNGKLAAGPARGGEEIMTLITAVIQAISMNMIMGNAHLTADPRPLGGSDSGAAMAPPVGHELEEFSVQREDGEVLTFADAIAAWGGTEAVPVVAWRDSCPYCSEIAEELQQFSERGEVVLLINEPIDTVRAQGLTGPVLQTVEVDASGVLGVPGTPGIVPLAGTTVSAQGGVGGSDVLRFLVEHARAKGTYVETPALARMEYMFSEDYDPEAHVGHDHNHAGHEHADHDHAGHDHAGHDHAGHDHAGHDHAGHDHAAHEHAGHDHAGHQH